MPAPQPWSYTSLKDFKQCPKKFYEKRVAKSVRDESTQALVWGNQVHKAFELYVGHGQPMMDVLKPHEAYLDRLKALPGSSHVELKVSLNKRAQPCGYFDKDVWWRGVLDFHNVNGLSGFLVDYKTGWRKPDWVQMSIFALWMFAQHPQLLNIEMQIYWVTIREWDRQTVTRSQIPELWARMTKDLRLYKQAFNDDIWPMRPSGLCPWCPVKTCPHWKPKPAGV